jgi:UDP-N-acetylglucosamine 2-epimerase (non-hydrolysing)
MINRDLKLAFVIGTRPEAIKLAPLILLAQQTNGVEVLVAVSGQHKEMLEPVLKFFNIKTDINFQVMINNQGLAYLTSKVLESTSLFLKENKPDYLFVQGDTTTAFAATLAAFYEHIPVCHIEAGLRTHDKYFPYPEEVNRVMTSTLATYHFCPTANSAANLENEGIKCESIVVTGNTVVDSLLLALEKVSEIHEPVPGLADDFFERKNKMVLITGHRRESFGAGFDSICQAIATLAEKYPEVDFVYPVHLNPNVREPVFRLLKSHQNVHLIEPVDYPSFVRLMKHCYLILTDSGGIQEEAPSLKKPVLIMRDNTERPEGVEAGVVKLVGTNQHIIVDETSTLIEQPSRYNEMIAQDNPYGTGYASQLIMNYMLEKAR